MVFSTLQAVAFRMLGPRQDDRFDSGGSSCNWVPYLLGCWRSVCVCWLRHTLYPNQLFTRVSLCTHSFGSGGMWAQFFPPIIQRSDSPVYISYTSAEHPNLVLLQSSSASMGRGCRPNCTIPLSVLQQRGGNKLLKGLGSCKLASSLGQGQLRLSKLTLHPLLPSPVLPVFSPCGNATNQTQMLDDSHKSENKNAVIKSVPIWYCVCHVGLLQRNLKSLNWC